MFKIRDARPDDRPTLIAFTAALQDFEREIEAHRRPGAEMAAAHYDRQSAWMAQHPGGANLVAELGEEVLGWLLSGVEIQAGVMVPEFARQTGWISDLWVRPDARGQGIGRALIAEAERRFQAAGIRRIEIAAVSGNLPAIGLYRALGFADYELTLGKTL